MLGKSRLQRIFHDFPVEHMHAYPGKINILENPEYLYDPRYVCFHELKVLAGKCLEDELIHEKHP